MGKRDVWREVLEGVREIKTGGGRRIAVAVPDLKPPGRGRCPRVCGGDHGPKAHTREPRAYHG
jgi:hypothetical protein